MSQLLSFTPIADTYVHCDTGEAFLTNHGGGAYLRCGPQYAFLLRFWVEGIAAGGTVESVTLEMVKNGVAADGTNYLREMLNHTWTEFGATYAHAVMQKYWWWGGPFVQTTCNHGFGTGLDYGNSNISTLTSSSSAENGTVFTFVSTGAFTSLLQRYAGSPGKLDLCCPIGIGFWASSRSGGYPPQLKLTYRLAAPAISSFSPPSATSAGTTIAVQGSNFGLAAGDLDGIRLINQGSGGDWELDDQTWIGGQEVRGDLPGGAAYGTYRIRVTIDGQSCLSQDTFAFNPSGPYISSISPESGKAAQQPVITIAGQNFDPPVSEVVLVGQKSQGEKAAASFTRISGTEITATPPGTLPVGRYRIRVTADGESMVSDGEYACRLGPVVW